MSSKKQISKKQAAPAADEGKAQKPSLKAVEGDKKLSGSKRNREEAAAAAAAGGAGAKAEAVEAAAGTEIESMPPGFSRKRRVLVFGSRGLTARFRHLVNDIRSLLPHHKKDAKLDAKDNMTVVNEIAVSKSCDTVVFFESRKKRDLYLWLSRAPSGPSVKFQLVNVHTMDELRMTGNCLKGSRAILSFDQAFDREDTAPEHRLMRELLSQAFAVPRGHPRSQPFHDHVLNFSLADGKVWVRHYQIVDKAADAKAAARMLAAGEQPTVLVEIGPRFVLDPVRIFAGSMGGPTLWTNPLYIPPNALRMQAAAGKAETYKQRMAAEAERKERAEDLVLPADPVADVFRDEDDGLGLEGKAAGKATKKEEQKGKKGKAAAAAEESEEEEEEDDEEFDDDDELEDEDDDGDLEEDHGTDLSDSEEEESEEEEEAPPAPVKGQKKQKFEQKAPARAAAPAPAPAAKQQPAKGKAAAAAAAPAAKGKGKGGK